MRVTKLLFLFAIIVTISSFNNKNYETRCASNSSAFYQLKIYLFRTHSQQQITDTYLKDAFLPDLKKLNFLAVFYAVVISGSIMPTLMYMTPFDNMKVRDSLWKAFFESPEWLALKVMPKYQKTVSHADILLLYPTEYSDY